MKFIMLFLMVFSQITLSEELNLLKCKFDIMAKEYKKKFFKPVYKEKAHQKVRFSIINTGGHRLIYTDREVNQFNIRANTNMVNYNFDFEFQNNVMSIHLGLNDISLVYSFAGNYFAEIEFDPSVGIKQRIKFGMPMVQTEKREWVLEELLVNCLPSS